ETVIRDRLFTSPPPASLLASLVSAFVADSYDDLYLPMNFLAFASCGSDIRASGCNWDVEFARSARQSVLAEPSSRASLVGSRSSRGARTVAKSGKVLAP